MSDNNNDTANENDDTAPITEDTDIFSFTTQIENKLRTNFSSFDVTRCISQITSNGMAKQQHQQQHKKITTNNKSNSSTVSTPGRYVYLLTKCLPNMEKQIQLRTVIAFLGLEPDVGQLFASSSSPSSSNDYANTKFHKMIQLFLNEASRSDEDWIKAIAGIVKKKLFYTTLDSLPATTTKATACFSLKKTVEDIIKTVVLAADKVYELSSRAYISILNEDDDDEMKEKEQEALLDSFQFNQDQNPFYVPFYYSLISPKLLKEIMPELFCTVNDDNDDDGEGLIMDFQVDEDAAILKVDQEMEVTKAMEELRGLEQKEKTRKLAEARQKKQQVMRTNTTSTKRAGRIQQGSSRSNGLAGTGSTSEPPRMLMAGMKKKELDTGSRFMKTNAKIPTSSLNLQRGKGRLGKVRRKGLGRGALADAIGGKSLSNPAFRGSQLGTATALRRPRGGKTHLSKFSMKGSLDKKASSLGVGMSMSGATSRSGGTISGGVKKVKMIDSNEIDGLNKEREERKRKEAEEELRQTKESTKKRKIQEKTVDLNKKKKTNNGGAAVAVVNAVNDASVIKADVSNIVAESPAEGEKLSVGSEILSTKQIKAENQSEIEPYSCIQNITSSNEQSQYMQQHGYIPQIDTNINQLPSASSQAIHSTLGVVNGEQMIHAIQNNNALLLQHQMMLQQQESQQIQQQLLQTNINQAAVNQPVHHEQNWRQLLEKSNKLSAEDRFRAEQFFTNRSNPTPECSVYTMKLHEDKGVDPETKQIIKETLYLELNYNTYNYRQLRKIKRK